MLRVDGQAPKGKAFVTAKSVVNGDWSVYMARMISVSPVAGDLCPQNSQARAVAVTSQEAHHIA